MDEPRNFLHEAYKQMRATIENTAKEAGEKALEKAYAPNKVEDTIDSSEALGKLAYEAYHADAVTTPLSVAVKWEDQGYLIRQHWNAAAQAVAERVLELQRVAMEASE